MNEIADLLTRVMPNSDDDTEHEWAKLWNLSSDIFTLLDKTELTTDELFVLTLITLGRAMVIQANVPKEIAWMNLLSDPKYKAMILTAFATQEDFARRIAEIRAVLPPDEEEPPAVRH